MPGPDFVIDEINGNPDMWKNFSFFAAAAHVGQVNLLRRR
jgi:hypothetical protein